VKERSEELTFVITGFRFGEKRDRPGSTGNLACARAPNSPVHSGGEERVIDE
jgi:hypothetical protein